ncbi:hypothetical protein TRFO_31919 [Tritrichomonas foetus]|uniref:Uncharacterized protein n=1 Tax=Tritrichomonas foetus TaxID=1144522 RepID=A0A1J4JRB4_9EUKA|nr:hypothetical protein TRFO_31919 [Tritrichomonas foetus]|eukprot:OHT01290.1 hypothetical protein TRFO_31919 [Tritrichomonas foetus]
MNFFSRKSIIMFKSFSSIYVHAGQKIVITFPSRSETHLLFVRRYQWNEKANINNIYIRSVKKQNSSKTQENIITFKNDDNDFASLDIAIKPDSTLSIAVDGDVASVRFLFGTNAFDPLQTKNLLSNALTKQQQDDVSKELLVEVERSFRSEDPFLVMLLVFEKHFSSNFFHQFKPKFPKFIQNVLNTSLRRLPGDAQENLAKIIYFIDFRLSLGEKISEAAGIIFITIVNSICNNNSLLEEIKNMCYDSSNFISFQALFTFISNKSLIADSLLLPVSFLPVNNIDSIAVIYSYAVEKKLPIHYSYLNLFSSIVTEKELKMVFKPDQIFGLDEMDEKIIEKELSSVIFFEKQETIVQPRKPISFKPRKVSDLESDNSKSQPEQQNSHILPPVQPLVLPPLVRPSLSLSKSDELHKLNIPFVEPKRKFTKIFLENVSIKPTIQIEQETNKSDQSNEPNEKTEHDEKVASKKSFHLPNLDIYTKLQIAGLVLLFVILLLSSHVFLYL